MSDTTGMVIVVTSIVAGLTAVFLSLVWNIHLTERTYIENGYTHPVVETKGVSTASYWIKDGEIAR